MAQEDKQLLLKDLSARLLYGVVCRVEFKDMEGWKVQNMPLKGVFIDECYFSTDKGSTYSKEFKPYLRTLDSMTEEEKVKYHSYCDNYYDIYFDTIESIDYLNSIHVDYRGLIPKELAIEVTEENNPYKK